MLGGGFFPGTPLDRIVLSGWATAVNHSTFIPWHKPKNCVGVHFLAVGGGGGGGAGYTAGAGGSGGTSPGGGGGGGASASSCFMPAAMLPETVYISVGLGGRPVINASGTAGTSSVVSVAPLTAQANYCNIIAIGFGGGLGGVPSNATTGGAVGTAGTTVTSLIVAYGCRGVISTFIGSAGIIGGLNVGGAACSITNGIITTGGGGGGGLPNVTLDGTYGGSVLATSSLTMAGDMRTPATNIVYSQGGAVSAGNGVNGAAGESFLYGLVQATGGAGGSSTSTRAGGPWTAGNGGTAGFGGGGGGGGGVFTGGTRGQGGAGGDGMVIITWW